MKNNPSVNLFGTSEEPRWLSRDPLKRSYFEETSNIDEISHLSTHRKADLHGIETIRENLVALQRDADGRNNIKLSTQLGLAKIYLDISARKNTLIANRDNQRFSHAFNDLFVSTAFKQTGSLAELSLTHYQSLPYGANGERVQMSGLMHEMTALLLSYDPSDPLKFAVPSSAYDDQISPGFHFDLMLYDLNRTKDFRRAIDIKSRRNQYSEDKISTHARTTFSNEVLHNGRMAPLWDGSIYELETSMRTLHALIDIAKDRADPTTIKIVDNLRDEFYWIQFDWHQIELRQRLGDQSVRSSL